MGSHAQGGGMMWFNAAVVPAKAGTQANKTVICAVPRLHSGKSAQRNALYRHHE